MQKLTFYVGLLLFLAGCDSGTKAKSTKSDKDKLKATIATTATEDLSAMQGAWRVKKHFRDGKPVEGDESHLGNMLLIEKQHMKFYDAFGRPRSTMPECSFKFIKTEAPPRKIKTVPPPLTPLEEKAGLTHIGFDAIMDVSKDRLRLGYGGFFGSTPKDFSKLEGPKASGTLVEYARIAKEELYPQPKLEIRSREQAIGILNQFGSEFSNKYLGENAREIESVEISAWPRKEAENPKSFYDVHLSLFQWVPEVQELALEKTSIRDQGLVHLSKLTGLRDLSLEDTLITGAGSDALQGLPDLESLNLSKCPLTLVGIKQVGNLKQVKRLRLNSTEIVDDWLEALNGMHALEYLDLQNTAIDGTGLKHLKNLPNLSKISLPFDLSASAKAQAAATLPDVEF